jgi:transposase
LVAATAGAMARIGGVVKPTPPSTPVALPDDPGALKVMVTALMQRVDALELSQHELQARHQQLELIKQQLELKKLRLEMELLRYKKWMYGPRADTLASLGEVDQMLLGFGEELDQRPAPALAEDQAGAKENHSTATSPRRVSRGRGRRNMANFDHLPVTRCEHDLAEGEKPCPCCGTMRQKIGEEVTWQIEYVPGRFERLEHVRFKYACRHCELNASEDGPQIQRADRPSATIDKGLAGPGLLAFVISSKYADYLPLYRLEDIFRRSGFEIARSTQSLWCRDVAELVTPLHELMIQRVLSSRVVGTDDTIMPMLCPGEGQTKKARIWVYGGGDEHPYHIFDFTLSRGRDGPAQFLKAYKGTLLADAYGGYDGVVVGNQITRAGCWAHARRKFVDAQPTHPTIAAEAVAIIGRLYGIEEHGKALDIAARHVLRRAESAPILIELKERLLAWREQLLPKHPMAQAIGYTLNQWDALNVFASEHPDAAHVPIDNNASERQMKRIVLNRKNSLFVGNERAGRTAAILSSLTSTCRRHDIDPQRYLTQLLTNLPATPISQLDQWLPDNWKRRDTPPPTTL